MIQKMKRTTILFCLSATILLAADPQPVYLWPKGAPGSEGKTGDETARTTPQGERVIATVHKPSITPILPAREKATGVAVIIAPGGGHSELWADHEGFNAARHLSEHGI